MTSKLPRPLNADSLLVANCLDLDQHPDAWLMQKMLQDGEAIIVPTQLLRDILERLRFEQAAVLARDAREFGSSGQAPNFDLNLQLCYLLEKVVGE